MAIVRQSFDTQRIADISKKIDAEMHKIRFQEKIIPGQSVAITAGSRGIADIARVVQLVAANLKMAGAKPFIFPAMGSHGGATAKGQERLLAGFGITRSETGCPVRSSMEVDEIGHTADGLPVFVDRLARGADHLVVINRVKPHTKFEGPIESGMVKMMAVGMGKHKGAETVHRASVRFGMGHVVQSIGKVVLEKMPFLFGVGLVENACHQLAEIRFVSPDSLFEEEAGLLALARRKMARIPFSDIDLLIVDEMGKDISGTGMDTNITGVNRDILGGFSSLPRTKRLFVRDLTPQTGGNALGIGFADFTTARLVRKIDREKTTINCLAGISPEKGAIPLYFDTDRECLEAAVHCLGTPPPDALRIVHIRNTRYLENLSVSKAYQKEMNKNDTLEQISDWAQLSFDEQANLISPFGEAH
jgi:hypothetical protein